MFDAVIIGAGVAGLAAAREYAAAGKKVCIVEARSRIGGRAWSTRKHGALVENGAEFIHGTNHVLARQVRAQRIKTAPWEPAQSVAYGNRMYDPQLVAVLNGLNRSFWESLLDYAGPDVPLSAFLEGHFMGTAGRVMLGEIIRDTEGADVSRISTAQLRDSMSDANDDLAGAAAVLVQGYGKVLSGLASGVRIDYKKVVTKVAVKAKSVVVTCADGSRITARRCICTVPLGVLQAESISFTPELPSSMAESIQRIGMGKSVKVHLWFKSDPIGIESLHTDQLVGNWWRPVVQPKNGLILYSGLAGGSPAEYIAALTESEAIQGCLNDLTALFGNEVVKRFAAGSVVNWVNDPFTRGGYSFNTVGLTDERDILARPLFDNKLMFAGEAIPTSNWNYGTVHGAWDSGRLAALHLLHTSRSK